MPGTTLVIGVRFGGLGEITARSACGVKARSGRPASELLAGVVAGLVVVRSGLSTQVASATWRPSCPSSRSHRLAAAAELPVATNAPTATTTIQRIFLLLLIASFDP